MHANKTLLKIWVFTSVIPLGSTETVT